MIKDNVKALAEKFGYRINRIEKDRVEAFDEGPEFETRLAEYSAILEKHNLKKAHYGSGSHLLGEGWANIDLQNIEAEPPQVYLRADLTAHHPFPTDYFQYAFSEDFLEHLTQDGSLIFLAEVFRCLRPGGVLRLSFPGLREVLKKHFRKSDYQGAATGRDEAYTPWGHYHFYCEESLTLVAEHIGFSDIQFLSYQVSEHEALRDLEFRDEQKELNLYTELTK
jgi:predicted SAM-dependent methyltransferase